MMKIVGVVIAASSAVVRTLSGRGRRNRSIACMSDATVLAFCGRRTDRRSASISESGATATSAEPRRLEAEDRRVHRLPRDLRDASKLGGGELGPALEHAQDPVFLR